MILPRFPSTSAWRAVRAAAAAGVAGVFLLAPPVPAQEEIPDTTAAADTIETLPAARGDTTANFVGTVASAVTGEPISGARIAIPEIQLGAITNEEGKFQVRELPPGMYDVRVHYLGYSTNQRPVRLRRGHVTRAVFLLERDVLEVADLKVEVKRSQRVDPMAPFKRRMQSGFGEFITREEIEKRQPQHTSDLLRTVPGVNVGPVQYGRAPVRMRSAGRTCRPVIFLDGVLSRNFVLDDLSPDAIEGIEVYRRGSETPPQFNTGSSRCGTLVVWTRTGGSANE